MDRNITETQAGYGRGGWCGKIATSRQPPPAFPLLTPKHSKVAIRCLFQLFHCVVNDTVGLERTVQVRGEGKVMSLNYGAIDIWMAHCKGFPTAGGKASMFLPPAECTMLLWKIR